VFLWSWFEYRKSIALIGPNHMALTFTDWWPAGLMEMPLPEFIEDMERVAGCGVDIIRTGPAWENYTRRKSRNSVEEK